MSVPPSFRRLTRARAARRLAFLLSIAFAAAAAVPFVTHGARADETAPRNLRRAAPKSGSATGAAAEFVPGHVLVRFRSETAARNAEGTPATGRGAILDTDEGSQIGATVQRFEGSDIVRGLRIAYVEPAETLAAVEAFKSRADVLYAEPDYVRRATALPNESEFTNLWGLRNTGQQIVDHFKSTADGVCPNGSQSTPCTFSTGSFGSDIKAAQAWDITTGSSNIVVGVIDEGVDINHQDLSANIFTNAAEANGAPGVDDDGDGKVDDVHGWNFTTCTNPDPTATPACGNGTVFAGNGTYPTDETDAHGTHVSGTIGALGNNNVGVVGVNWNVKILPLKFLGTTGGSTSNAIRAMAYAKMMRDKYVATGGAQGANVRVLNNSYGGGGFSQSEFESISSLAPSNILFVVAAGNEASNNDLIPTYPANYNAPNLISVAATNRRDELAFNDSFGVSYTNYGARTVHIAAPGSLILSTTPNNTYDFYYGTSMATPHVSGVAALALAAAGDTAATAAPKVSVQQLRSLVLMNGDPNVTNFANIYSQRRLNAFAAVKSAQENDTTPPAAPGNLQKASQSGRSVTLTFIAPGDDGAGGNNASLYEVSFISPTNQTYVLKTALPKVPGTIESIGVNVPLRQTSGTLRVKAFDNVGNVSSSDVGVAVDPLVADPYATAETASAGLAPTGTALGFHADDDYRQVTLPFQFPFFGQQNSSVVLSSNGNLYLQPLSSLPPADPTNDQFADSGNSTQQLEGFKMVAGLWDDLRTDCTTNGAAACDVYENTSDPNKVVFRWEARTFANNADSGNPVEFEIELDRDGTIISRYGAGNAGVNPVVGIGAGEQGASYVIASHTSPQGVGPAISLTNAATVTYTVRTASAPPPSYQFSASNYAVSEGNITPQGTNGAQVLVTRSGDTSSSATLEVRTADNTAAVPCTDTTSLPGVAFARCDYATVVTTVSFAAGDTQPKTVTIPLVDDSFVEPSESFNVNLVSAGVTVATATVTITDNDTASTPNPYFNTDFFVRQQYLDFLSREPDADGFNSWRGLINGCAEPFNSNVAPYDPVANPSALCDRINVSANFFLSTEFQLKGGYVFRFYKVSFGRLPHYTEFTADSASVTGSTAAEVFAKKAAFADAWVQRGEFANTYNVMGNTQFVNTLMDRYGLAQITTPDPLNPDGSTKIPLTRADLINRLTAGTLTRAQAVRAIADSDQVGSAEFNSAFVSMQYFGYLRRDPDQSGYDTWTGFLASHPGQFRNMVFAFIGSPEYKSRFGNP